MFLDLFLSVLTIIIYKMTIQYEHYFALEMPGIIE